MIKNPLLIAIFVAVASSTSSFAATGAPGATTTNAITTNHALVHAALGAQPNEQNSLAALFNATATKITQNSAGKYQISLKPDTQMFLMSENIKHGAEVNHISMVKFASFATKYAAGFGFKAATPKAQATTIPVNASNETEIQLTGTITITTNNGNLVSFAPQIMSYNKAENRLFLDNAQIVGDTAVDLKDVAATKDEVSVALTSSHWEPTNENTLNAAGYVQKEVRGKQSSTMVLRNLETRDPYQNHVAFFRLK